MGLSPILGEEADEETKKCSKNGSIIDLEQLRKILKSFIFIICLYIYFTI